MVWALTLHYSKMIWKQQGTFRSQVAFIYEHEEDVMLALIRTPNHIKIT